MAVHDRAGRRRRGGRRRERRGGETQRLGDVLRDQLGGRHSGRALEGETEQQVVHVRAAVGRVRRGARCRETVRGEFERSPLALGRVDPGALHHRFGRPDTARAVAEVEKRDVLQVGNAGDEIDHRCVELDDAVVGQTVEHVTGHQSRHVGDAEGHVDVELVARSRILRSHSGDPASAPRHPDADDGSGSAGCGESVLHRILHRGDAVIGQRAVDLGRRLVAELRLGCASGEEEPEHGDAGRCCAEPARREKLHERGPPEDVSPESRTPTLKASIARPPLG
jgi:hypothetical protein